MIRSYVCTYVRINQSSRTCWLCFKKPWHRIRVKSPLTASAGLTFYERQKMVDFIVGWEKNGQKQISASGRNQCCVYLHIDGAYTTHNSSDYIYTCMHIHVIYICISCACSKRYCSPNRYHHCQITSNEPKWMRLICAMRKVKSRLQPHVLYNQNSSQSIRDFIDKRWSATCTVLHVSQLWEIHKQ